MRASVTYCPGDGTTVELDVDYISDFPRGPDGTCAYCLGDPCAEQRPTHPRIASYYARNPNAATCPMCDGRAT